MGQKIYKLTTEAYHFVHKGHRILFFPLVGVAMEVNDDTITLLNLLRKGPIVAQNKTQEKVLTFWENLNILNGKERVPTPPKPTKNFLPVSVTLFLTTGCNLSCIYCYADSGRSIKYMPIQIAEAALNQVIKNALKLGKNTVNLHFHGGGEPTYAWDLLIRIIDDFYCLCEKYQINPKITLGTNVFLNKEKVKFLIKKTHGAAVSLDGFEEIQNFQRPCKNGKGSFKVVFSAIKEMDKKDYPYGIRCTVTSKSVEFLKEIVRFVANEFSCKKIQFEPVFLCGKATGAQWMLPPREIFVESFREARQEGKKYGIDVKLSGARIDFPNGRFCRVGENFFVTHSGFVTSCLEVVHENDPRAKYFFYGKYNQEKKNFDFDYKKLNFLRSLWVKNYKDCKDCFAKWYCGGDCPAKRAISGNTPLDKADNYRCWIVRELTKDLILESIQSPLEKI